MGFCGVAGLIVCGLVGDQGYLGAKVLLSQGGFAPQGYWPIVLTMVIILVNFQGTEIIGLAAGECKDPAKSIPIAVRNVSWRVIALYIIPITLLLSIMPWDKASLKESVFAAALAEYGFDGLASAIAFVVLVAGVSCANSGLYGGARALHALARMDMAPAFLGKLNKTVCRRILLSFLCAPAGQLSFSTPLIPILHCILICWQYPALPEQWLGFPFAGANIISAAV